jgi:GAF domain-containing protein
VPIPTSSREGRSLNFADTLIHQLPHPVALVSHSGETLEANRALTALAERCHVPPQLTLLFGVPFTRILARAWIERHLQAQFPLIVGPEPHPVFSVSFMSAGDRSLGVVLHEVTHELELQHKLELRDRQLAVLRDVAVALSGVTDIEHLTRLIYDQTCRVLPSRSFYAALYEREAGQVTFPGYMEEGEWKDLAPRAFGDGLTEHLLRTGKPLLLNRDVREQARALGVEPQGRACLAWLGAPMVVDGEPIGVIAIQDFERADVYDEHDVELLTVIAGQAAAAVKNARALAAERHAYRELTEAHERVLETERLRGVTETVGALNHEINNPLSAIAGNAQLLLKHPEDVGAAALVKIETIHEAARRIQRVTGKMASLIQASALAYPGQTAIIDVQRSVARGEEAEPSAEMPTADAAAAPERPLPPNVEPS